MNEVYDAEIMLAKEKIRDVVNRYDPMGLLDICPEDEYDPEIELMIARVEKGMTVEELAGIVHAVFLEMFEESLDSGLCVAMAEEIHNEDSL